MIQFFENRTIAQGPSYSIARSAMDNYTLHVELRSPTPFFLNLQEDFAYYAVPQHAVEAARKNGTDWTSPERPSSPHAMTASSVGSSWSCQ